MSTFVLVLHAAAVFASQPAYLQNLFPAEQATQVIRIAQQNFWGKAALPDGTFVRPGDDREREALPIPRNEAMRIVQSSAAAGLGDWCGVEWQPYYLAFMSAERTKPWTEKQLAFIDTLFGVAQGSMHRAMSRVACAASDRDRVARMLKNAT